MWSRQGLYLSPYARKPSTKVAMTMGICDINQSLDCIAPVNVAIIEESGMTTMVDHDTSKPLISITYC